MDLSKAEKTLSDLEENSQKVAEVTKSIEKLKKISKELSKLPEDVEKNSTATALRIVDESNKLNKLIEDTAQDIKTQVIYETNEIKKSIDEYVKDLNFKLDKNQENQNQELLKLKDSYENQIKKLSSMIIRNFIFLIILLIGIGSYIFYLNNF